MDKKQFVENVITGVRSLSVTSVLSTRMNLVRRGGYHKGLCPFHNDKKMGSFVATEGKSIWKCFSCGCGGDNIKFVSLFDNINYVESAFRIALENGQISVSEHQEYFERRRYSKEQVSKIEKKFEELDKEKMKSNIAESKVLDRVFKIFIKFAMREQQKQNQSNLLPEHIEHLKTIRGLTEEEIEEGFFFTFPTRRIIKDFSKAIKNEFGNEEVLSTIPGFFKDIAKNNYTFAKHKGIGIGIKNANGEIVGIQIRHDEGDEDKGRYVWFSSSFADFSDKYEEGTSSGSPIDVVYPKGLKSKYPSIIITEGRFKAMQITKNTGAIAISVQGVGTWKNVLKEIQQIPTSNVLKNIAPDGIAKIACILVAFDADMNYKYQVFQQARKMTDHLELNGYFVYYLSWNEELGKGIDDIYLSNNANAIKKYDKYEWDKAYDFMIGTLLDHEDYLEMKDVPEEVLKKYFKEHLNIEPEGKNKGSDRHKAFSDAIKNNKK